MISAIRRAVDAFRGSGSVSVTIPTMDGALRPNSILEDAPLSLTRSAPDNLIGVNGEMLFSEGATVCALAYSAGVIGASVKHRFSTKVVALAGSASGSVAVALADGAVQIKGGQFDGAQLAAPDGGPGRNISAIAYKDEGVLLLCQGSAVYGSDAWQRDLLQRGATGSVWRVDLAKRESHCIAKGLAYPCGIMPTADGAVVVSEAWRHRLLRIADGGKPVVVLDQLPGYPCRLSSSPGGGWWLSVFAPRNQLVEFVLREKQFRERMMVAVRPEHWIVPTLTPAGSFMEPLQGGELRQLGKLKPWAPTRSHGLAVQLDSDFQPIRSVHSRANGRRHGVTSCLARENMLWLTSRGGNAIVGIDLSTVCEDQP